MFGDKLYNFLPTMRSMIGQPHHTPTDVKQVELILDLFERLYTKSHKFKLTADFVKFISTMEDEEQFPYLIKIKPLVRLPYPIMWIERTDHGCERGFLVMQEPDSNVFRVCLITNNRNYEPGKHGFNFAYMQYDPSSLMINENGWLRFEDLAMDSIEFNVEMKEQGFYENEACLLMDYLARLNSPSLVELTAANLSVLNKKRQRNGKYLLSDHRVVDLSRVIKRAMTQSQGDGAPGSQRRMHWVRGHFKVRKSGIFWWNPHLSAVPDEGQASIGFVDKDYVA